MPRSQDSFEELVDALLYAPIGIVLDIVERYPEHVSRGRRQVEVFEKLGSAVLRGFGFSTADQPRGPAAPQDEPTPPDVPAELAAVAAVAETSSALVDVDIDEILDGTVGEVSDAIDGLSAPLIEKLIEREQAGKNRVTVLRAAKKRLGELRDDDSSASTAPDAS